MRLLPTKHLRLTVSIIAVLAITNLATAGFLWREKTTAPERAYPYIDIARDYIPQEHFIVNIQPLREELNQLVQAEDADTMSVYFEFLNTGANIQLNNELRFYPASLVKVPSALVAMKKVEKGDWKMGSMLILFEQDKDPRYGTLHQKPVGTRLTVEELLKALLIDSDNTAHNMLMRNLSEQELNELKDMIGLDDLFNEKNEVSAKEYSRLFRALYNSSFLKRENSQRLLEWLAQTKFDHTLPAGMPPGTIFAHKIGEDNAEKNYLDSGIVYLPNRPYLLTVMIKQHDQKTAEAIMERVSKAAYEYINGYE